MRKMLYFGNRDRMTWVPVPDASYDGSRVGWDGGVTTLLSGGAFVARSTSAHRTYNYTWSKLSRNEIRSITDYAEGVWGSGAIYLVDPFAEDKNLLPQHWATPRTVLQDGIVLSGGPRAQAATHPIALTNPFGYPTQAINYNYATSWPSAQLRPKFYLPIPPGYTAWFGAHGVAAQSNTTSLTVTPDGGELTRIPVLSVDTATRFSHSWDGDTVSGIEISLSRNDGTTIISGLMLQLLPTGTFPEEGGFISGQGHSGLRFSSQPSLTQDNRVLDRQSLTAQLIEDEAWR